MTELQKLILDALDQLGAMTRHELETACFIGDAQRGGFTRSLSRLFNQRLVNGAPDRIHVTRDGVWAIEAYNTAKYRKL